MDLAWLKLHCRPKVDKQPDQPKENYQVLDDLALAGFVVIGPFISDVSDQGSDSSHDCSGKQCK